MAVPHLDSSASKILAIDHASGLPALVRALSRHGEVESVNFSHFDWDLLEDFARRNAGCPHLFVHPGCTELAESVLFQQRCVELALTPLMPPARSVGWASHTHQVLALAQTLWGRDATLILSDEPVTGLRELERVLLQRQIGFPFVLRAAQGGGGSRGIWVVRSGEELRDRGPGWFEQIERRFGIPLVFIERVLTEARHWVLPFVRNQSGEVHFFGISEASLQWRCRKMIEWFAPLDLMGFGLEPKLSQRMQKMVETLLEQARFVGVGAVEFLSQDDTPYLVGVLPRLPRHWIAWERAFGVQAVDLQIQIATTGQLQGPPMRDSGSWVGLARVMSMDPLLEIPKPGKILEWEVPRGWEGLDTASLALSANLSVPDLSHETDATLGWLMAAGRSRLECLQGLLWSLSKLWISGTLMTNERQLRELLEHPWVREGIFHAGFLDEEFLPRLSYDHPIPAVQKQGPQDTLTTPGGVRMSAYPMIVEQGEVLRWRVRIGDWFQDLAGVRPVHSKASRNRLPVRSLCSGTLSARFAKPGMIVPAHRSVCTIESVGSLVPHPLPRAVSVEEWLLEPGSKVQEGQILGWVQLQSDGGMH